MADGVRLAATLYLPDASAGPQPCLLEALPYRKDDLTSSYAEGYRTLRDEHGYAVCRLDLRGTGSSEGDATDEYPAVEQSDLVEVIAWLADQPWCDGSVGMWGTSYSGFNSLQMACERPPALKAVCAIYASDDRWTDDVHWRGGALRLVDLVDYCHYMTPMTMLPPVPAVWAEGRSGLARGVAAPAGDPGAVGADLAPGAPRRPLLAARLGPQRRAGNGYDRIACPVMIVAGWADGYRNNSFRTVEALRRGGRPAPAARRSLGARRPGDGATPDRGSTSTARWSPGSTAGCATRWRATEPHRDRVDVFVRTSTRPEPDLDLHEGRWVSDAWPSAATRWVDVPLDGTAVPRRRARRRHGGLDRLRRAPAVGPVRATSATTTPAR